MYSALIELGWVHQWFDGHTADEIMKKVEEYQDFDCLLEMASFKEKKKGKSEAEKLSQFIFKYRNGKLTMEDLANLNVELSAGNFICHQVKTI